MTTREHLRQRIEALGISQAELAREAETTTASLCRFLNKPPSKAERYESKLAEALARIEKRQKRKR
jgi:predicted transcriptional regulator